MKVIIIFAALCAAVLAQGPQALPPTGTLKFFFDLANQQQTAVESQMQAAGAPVAFVNRECAKENLHFDKNGEKVIASMIGLPLVLLAFDICTIGNNMKHLMSNAQHTESVDQVTDASALDCFRKGLKELDPTASLLKNFDESSVTTDSEVCKEKLNDKKFVEFLHKILTEADFDWYTCGKVSLEELQVIGFRMPIIKFGNIDDMAKWGEAQTMAEKVLALQKKAFVCQLGRVDAA